MSAPRSGTNGTGRRAFIVANVVPRWVSDFNVVSTELVKAGYDVTLYASAPDPDEGGFRNNRFVDAARERLDPAVKVEYLPYSTVRVAPLAFLSNLLLAFRLAIRHPDALFILWTSIPILTWGPAMRVLRRRVVYMVTGLGPVFAHLGTSNRRRFVVQLLQRFLFTAKRCRILVHNRDDKAFLCDSYGLPGSRVVVTGGCGVDPEEFPLSPWPPVADAPDAGTGEPATPDGTTVPWPSVPLVLCPVRMLVDKGVLDAAEASARLAKAGVEHEMWFTSNLDPSHPTAVTADDVERITRSNPSVRFVGYLPDLVDAYRHSTVACIPTYFPEGLPTALLEAASMGRPIVTCDNVGGRDFIRDGVDGLLVPPRSPEDLADALERMLTRPADAERMRDSAHQRFLHGYTKQDMLDLTVATIRRLGFPVQVPTTTGGAPT